MRILLTGILIFVNFILQTTLLPYISIGGILPNTVLIIVVSYALLRGSTEGAIVGFFSGLPIICSLAAIVYESIIFITGFFLQGNTTVLYFLVRLALPEAVYTAVVTIPIYRLLFGINEWLELKEKYKYRLF